ncbi:proto-oncogene Mas-like [Aquarana catesbeiana]|uniref:proto-oncogene Mas-like n=1 Tax=Aquarana catesbeiana TaxID=8400 RepID=UPI003CCA2E8B
MNFTSGNETDKKDLWTCIGAPELLLPIVDGVFIGICVLGLVGNIIVFWNLCFRIQRNKYTVYIANLCVADTLLLSVVMLTLMVEISNFFGLHPGSKVTCPFYVFVDTLYYPLVYSGKNILTAISVERCISILFPIWYRTCRPKKFSTMACAVLWLLGILEGLLEVILCDPEAYTSQQAQCVTIEVMIFVSAIGICLPLMVISSVALLYKIRRTVGQEYSPKLYIIIIVAVIVFILSVLPLNIVRFLVFCNVLKTVKLVFISQYWLVTNCVINPYIYFLVGKICNQTTCCSIKDSLQRAFVVETDTSPFSSEGQQAQ